MSKEFDYEVKVMRKAKVTDATLLALKHLPPATGKLVLHCELDGFAQAEIESLYASITGKSVDLPAMSSTFDIGHPG